MSTKTKKTKAIAEPTNDPFCEGFYHGVAWAAQVLVTLLDEPSHAQTLLNEAGVSVRRLKDKYNVDSYDINKLRKAGIK